MKKIAYIILVGLLISRCSGLKKQIISFGIMRNKETIIMQGSLLVTTIKTKSG